MTTTAAVWSDNIEPLRGNVEVIIPSRNPAPNLSHDRAGNMKLTSFHTAQAINSGLCVIG